MKFNVVTIFPNMIYSYLGESILKRAIEKGIIEVSVFNLRDFTSDRHKTTDDYPYGGGSGMVMKPDPFFRIIEEVWPEKDKRRVVLLSPRGRPFTQHIASDLSLERKEVVLLCGRYEAIDERVRRYLADDEISIGDYVLTGGELPSLVIIDAIARLIPGVLGDSLSPEEESFTCGLLEYPHYTRPENFRGMSVPEVLLSGNHSAINRWRKKESLKITLEKRPGLIGEYTMSDEEKEIFSELLEEME